MSTTYTYQREIYDQTAFLNYVRATLPTASNTYINNGAINIVFPSAITKATLDTLVANFYNTSVAPNSTPHRNISIGNSTSNILLSTSNFTGYFEDVSDYASVTCSIYSDVPSASNGVNYQFSSDGSNVDVTQSYTARAGGYLQTFPVISRYMRLSYSNGSTAQTAFRLQTISSYYQNTQIGQYANEKLLDFSFVTLSKNIITGRNAAGLYENVGSVNSKLNVNVPSTAVGTLATAYDVPLVELEFSYSINPETATSNVIGLGTVVQSNNLAVISSGSNSNSMGTLTSKRCLKYRVGQGVKTTYAVAYAPGITGNTQLVGVGNSVDGLFYGYNGSNFGVLRRYNSIDTWTYQSNWSYDKFDGTGPSGMVLNPQLGNIYNIQYQYAFGVAGFYVQEANTGDKYLAHKINTANSGLTTIIQTPTFPISIMSSNSTNTSNVSIKVASTSAFNEGYAKCLGPRFGDDNSKTLNTNAYVNVITLRNNTTFNGKSNNIPIIIKNFTASTDTRQVIVGFFRNATIGGTPAFSNINASKSIAATDYAGTTVTGGSQIHSFCLGNSTGLGQSFEDFEITLEPGDTISAAARVPAAANTVVSVALSWVEDF